MGLLGGSALLVQVLASQLIWDTWMDKAEGGRGRWALKLLLFVSWWLGTCKSPPRPPPAEAEVGTTFPAAPAGFLVKEKSCHSIFIYYLLSHSGPTAPYTWRCPSLRICNKCTRQDGIGWDREVGVDERNLAGGNSTRWGVIVID